MSNSIDKNQYITKGDSWALSLIIKDTDGNVIDITGETLTLNIKANTETETSLIEETATITDGANGLAEINITSETMDALDVGNYYWGIEYIDGSGQVITLVKGLLTIGWDTN